MQPPSTGPSLRHDRRTATVSATAPSLKTALGRIGTAEGWFFSVPAWAARLKADELLRRVDYPRAPIPLEPGDKAGFWVVEAVEEAGVRFRALARMPGTAWLDVAWTAGQDGLHIEQTFWFEPAGALGRAYWVALKPAHALVYAATLKALVRAAESG